MKENPSKRSHFNFHAKVKLYHHRCQRDLEIYVGQRYKQTDSRIYYRLRIYVYSPMKLSKLNVHHPVEKPARDEMTSSVRLCLDDESH